MNIYLDIWGTLYRTAAPIEDRMALLSYILEKCPESTFWLTTYCKHGENRSEEVLSREFPLEFAKAVAQTVKIAEWGSLKTEGIDFQRPFFWLDDNCSTPERMILKGHNAEANFIAMNPLDPDSAKRALALIRARFEKV